MSTDWLFQHCGRGAYSSRVPTRAHTVESLRRVLGQTMRELRVKKGLTLEDLADRAQSHANVISRIELGDEDITAINLIYVGCKPQRLP